MKLREAVERFLGRNCTPTTLGEFVKEAEAALAEPVADEPVAWALFTNKPKSPRIRTLSAEPPSAEYREIARIEGEAWMPLYTRPAAAPSERGEYPPLPEPAEPGSDGICCGNYATGGEYMGSVEQSCCGNPIDRCPAMYTADQMRAYVNADRAQKVPLTEDQVFASEDLMYLNGSLLQLAMPQLIEVIRTVERAHGIGAKP